MFREEGVDFDRYLKISSLSYNAEYWDWNAKQYKFAMLHFTFILPMYVYLSTLHTILLFLVINTRRHKALWFWGRGRERPSFNYIFYGEPS